MNQTSFKPKYGREIVTKALALHAQGKDCEKIATAFAFEGVCVSRRTILDWVKGKSMKAVRT